MTSPNAAPRAIIKRMKSQPCMGRVLEKGELVNNFASSPHAITPE
jgi:hypothetical protein